MSGEEMFFVRAKKICQWCGWKFELSMAPFVAAEFRVWSDMVNAHRADCKEVFLNSPAASGLNEAGLHFLGAAR